MQLLKYLDIDTITSLSIKQKKNFFIEINIFFFYKDNDLKHLYDKDKFYKTLEQMISINVFNKKDIFFDKEHHRVFFRNNNLKLGEIIEKIVTFRKLNLNDISLSLAIKNKDVFNSFNKNNFQIIELVNWSRLLDFNLILLLKNAIRHQI